jgi:hypothetical protein
MIVDFIQKCEVIEDFSKFSNAKIDPKTLVDEGYWINGMNEDEIIAALADFIIDSSEVNWPENMLDYTHEIEILEWKSLLEVYNSITFEDDDEANCTAICATCGKPL